MKKWPFHPRPLPGESFASLVVRHARAHGLPWYTYLNWSLKHRNRFDPDCIGPDRKAVLSPLMSMSEEEVNALTLESLLGDTLSTLIPRNQMDWVLGGLLPPEGRKNVAFSHCPACLLSDPTPYFRLTWRCAYLTVCPDHNNLYIDRCGICFAGLPAHTEQDDSPDFAHCAHCSSLLLPQCVFAKSDWDVFEKFLAGASDTPPVSGPQVNSRYGLLSGVRFLVSFIRSSSAPSRRLRNVLARSLPAQIAVVNGMVDRRRFEGCAFFERRALLEVCGFLITEWPQRFVKACTDAGVTASAFLSLQRDRPNWVYQAIQDYLVKARYSPSIQEVTSAIQATASARLPINRSSVARRLGSRDAAALGAVFGRQQVKMNKAEALLFLMKASRYVGQLPEARTERASKMLHLLAIGLSAFSDLTIESLCELGPAEGAALAGQWEKQLEAVGIPVSSPEPDHPMFFSSRFGLALQGHSIRATAVALLKRFAPTHPWHSASALRGVLGGVVTADCT